MTAVDTTDTIITRMKPAPPDRSWSSQSDRRPREKDQRSADGQNLVEALMENRITVTLRSVEGMESVEQPQVDDDQRPDDIGHLLHGLPVLTQHPLHRGVRGRHHHQA